MLEKECKIQNNDYQDLDDDELIKIIHQNKSNLAEKTLLQRYQYLVYVKSKSYFLPGGDKSDVLQEGMIGLYKAIRDYKIKGNTSFKSFASICIVRNIISAVKKANRNKKKPLNSSISLNKPIYNNESDRSLLDIFDNKETTNNPLDLFLNKRKYNLLKSRIKQKLSRLEYRVYLEFRKDKSYEEIADTLDIKNKSVDNALQRIRKKLKNVLKNSDL